MVISGSDSDRAVRRGAGLIINQRDFEGFEEKTRHGTDRDVENLTKTLDKFGCQMREEKNLEEAGVLEGQAYEEALQTHWLSCASMLLCLRGPKFERARARRTPLRPWDEMVSHVIGTRGDHDIKFVDTWS